MSRITRHLVAALKDQLAGGNRRPPEGGQFLWNAFACLSRQRSYHMAGPNPISFAEIEAYCRMMRLPLEPRHLRILLAMDQVWLGHAYARAKAPDGMKTLPPASKRPLSATLFDAVFG